MNVLGSFAPMTRDENYSEIPGNSKFAKSHDYHETWPTWNSWDFLRDERKRRNEEHALPCADVVSGMVMQGPLSIESKTEETSKFSKFAMICRY